MTRGLVFEAFNISLLCVLSPSLAVLYTTVWLFRMHISGMESSRVIIKKMLRDYTWVLKKLLFIFKTDGGMLAKKLATIEAAIQPDPILVETLYLSESANTLMATTISNLNDRRPVYYMKIREAEFKRLSLERDGVQNLDLFISDGKHKLQVVFDPNNDPARVSGNFNKLMKRDKVDTEETLEVTKSPKNRPQQVVQKRKRPNK